MYQFELVCLRIYLKPRLVPGCALLLNVLHVFECGVADLGDKIGPQRLANPCGGHVVETPFAVGGNGNCRAAKNPSSSYHIRALVTWCGLRR